MPDRLKDLFFTSTSVPAFADAIQEVYPPFERDRFLSLVFNDGWDGLELKDRMHHTAKCLGQVLPADYAAALAILRRCAPAIRGFEAMVLADYVELFGQDEWDLSLDALAFFTRFGSAEFAIRPFLARDPERGMTFMYRLAHDPDPAVRRLASEGCRPRLPWAMGLPRFKADPSPILPILEVLRYDDSESVRRSVANNLNDISKDHLDLVLDLCERWHGQSEQTDAVVKHALRSLLKAGNPRAMALFGFIPPDTVRVDGLAVKAVRVPIGDDLVFTFTLSVDGETDCRVRLEYAVDYMKARGVKSRKVYQYSERVYAPGTYVFEKKHSMADRTTRKHHPGEHDLVVLVNGHEKAKTRFELTGS